MSSHTTVRFYVLGAGVCFPQQLTLETVEALEACSRVFSNLRPEQIEQLPHAIAEKTTSLWPCYRADRKRVENYRDVFDAIVDGAAEGGSTAWFTYGHPLVFDSVSQRLLRYGAEHGWDIHVLPAVSSLDTVLAELGYDPASGLLIHEATSLVRRAVPLLPDVATLLLQPAAFNSDMPHLKLDSEPADLSGLRDYLLRFYLSNHECVFVRSASGAREQLHVQHSTIGSIAELRFAQIAGTTLFIPAVTRSQNSQHYGRAWSTDSQPISPSASR